MTLNRKEQIEKSFGSKVVSYDRHAFLQKRSAKKLADFLPDTQPAKILEIGCGTGFLTEEIQKKYPQANILGIDISQDMVAACRQKFTGYQNLSFDVCDGENFKSENKFDLIVSNLTIQWFDDPVRGIYKQKNNLSNKGKFFFSTIGPDGFQEWKETLNDINLASGIIGAPGYPYIFDEDKEIIEYKNALDFLRSFKKIGAHQPRENYQSLSRRQLLKACKAFDNKYRGNITWHILYGCIG